MALRRLQKIATEETRTRHGCCENQRQSVFSPCFIRGSLILSSICAMQCGTRQGELVSFDQCLIILTLFAVFVRLARNPSKNSVSMETIDMKRLVGQILTVGLSATLLMGCGTFMHQYSLDLQSEPAAAHPAFGGVATDLNFFRHSIDDEPAHPGLAAFFALDVPLSAAADTVMLPRWALSKSFSSHWSKNYPRSRLEADGPEVESPNETRAEREE